MSGPDRPVYLKVSDAAHRIGVHHNTLAAWSRAGYGPPFVRMGPRGDRRYGVVELEAWIEQRRADTRLIEEPEGLRRYRLGG